MGSVENGAVLPKRVPLLKVSSLGEGRSFSRCRSRLTRLLLFEKVNYFQWIGIVAVFWFVVILFQAFLPGFVLERSGNFGVSKRLAAFRELGIFSEIGELDFGEGIRFFPSKLLLKFEKENEEESAPSGLVRRRSGLVNPLLALIIPDLSVDSRNLHMISVAVALRDIGYDMHLYVLEDGPAKSAWRSAGFPIKVLTVKEKVETAIDWLKYNCILLTSLETKFVLSPLSQEPFKSVPVVWTVDEDSLALRVRNYRDNNQTRLLHDWKQTFKRATVVVFPNHVLPLMYSAFDSGNFYVVPGSPAEAWEVHRRVSANNGHDRRLELGYSEEDFLIGILCSQFSYSGLWLELALVLQAVAPLRQEFSSASHLKVFILNGDLTDSYKSALETFSHKVGFVSGSVIHINRETDATDYLGIADVVIYGSFIEEQSFPPLLTRAMCLRKPIIAPNLAVITKHIDDGQNGYIFPKKNIAKNLVLFMAQSSPVGFLVPLNSDLSVDGAAEQVPILPGTNSFGRNNLGVVDRRVSRHHIILHASEGGAAELAVEGANPVVIRCGGEERKKLSPRSKAYIVDGDVLELIPGRYFFRYVLLDCSERSSCSRANTNRSQVEACSEEVWRHKRRKHDVEEDTPEAKSSEILVDSSFATIRHSRISDERSPAAFRLLQVKGIPSWANSSAVGLQDVVQGNVIFAVLSNYMVDIDWLLSECPFLEIIPRVLVIHGESGASLDIMKMKKPSNWVLHRPPLPISYGTHHSKAMLLVYPHGLRVIIHTANLIYVDWNNKTQALWMQDFPLKNDSAGKGGCPFENDLVDYLNSLKWPELNVSYESIGQARINPSFFRRFDFSCAMVRLVASVPGYHTGSNLKKWGHMKLRSTLENFTFDDDFKGSSLVYQFSSLGSLDEKWLSEFASSLSSGVSNDKSPLGPGKAQIIWPTVEDVRCSLEGYAAGSAIPSPMRNVEKEFLKKYWVRWKATQTGRCRAMPHIKSYTRYSGQRLAWFLLTSANLSKAAWGALQKNNSQLFIRSYELGVLFLPMPLQGSHLPASFSCTDDNGFEQASPNPKGTLVGMRHTCLVTLSGQKTAEETDSSDHVITLPVPYELPPRPYTSEDVPWSWERQYTKKDVHGQVWPCKVQLYMERDP